MKHTSEIFQRLSNGKFISSNSIDPVSRALYNDLEENQQDYADYFSQIDFQLCAGEGYFYFARKEAKINVENKLQGLLQWIDYLDFLKAYDTSFDVGTQFNIAQMEVQLRSNLELKEKLQGLLATEMAAACAKRFEEPTTKLSKVNCGLNSMNSGFCDLPR